MERSSGKAPESYCCWAARIASPRVRPKLTSRELAEWLGTQLDQVGPLSDEAERWLRRVGEVTPDHPEAGYGIRYGSHRDGARGSDRGDPGPVSDASLA